MSRAPREENRVPGLVAKSDVDDTPVIVEADSITKRLKVSAIITGGGSGGGTTNASNTIDAVPATQNITIQDTVSASTTGANNQSLVTGTPTVGSVATFTLAGYNTVRIEVTGTWTGTLTSEVSVDAGVTWTALGLHQGAYTTSTFTANFIGGGNVAGCTTYRLRATAVMTGTAIVTVTESVNTQSVYIANAAPSGNIVSVLNSSQATLTSGSVYTGTSEDVSNFSEMRVSVFSNVASATDGLSIQQSIDNVNWDITDVYTIAAATGKTFVVPRQGRYFRISYTNGGTNQTSFRLQSILNRIGTASSSQRPMDARPNDNDMVEVLNYDNVYNVAANQWNRARDIGVAGYPAVGLSDGTRVATIKAASTAPVATDTAVVVSMSPNSIATTLNAELPDVTGTFTNATQTTAIQATGLNGYDNVFVSISGTYTIATATFQGSDDGGSTWKNITVAARTDNPTIEGGYTGLSSIARGWNINIQGFDAFQVLSSAVATGTVNVRISAESAPTNAGATVGVASFGDGTNSGNVLKADGTAAGQNAAIISGTGMTTGTLTMNSGTPATAWFDMLNYAWVSIEILTNTTPATLSFQTSGDASQTNISATELVDASSGPNGVPVSSTTSATKTYHGPRTGRYFRISSNNGAGTSTVVITFFTFPSASILPTTTVGSNSATGSAVPANAFYLGLSDSGANLQGLLSAQGNGDASTGNRTLTVFPTIYNGTAYDRQRSATAASNTTGTGLLGVGNLMFDGTNWQTIKTANAGTDASSGTNQLSVGSDIYNGSNWDRQRSNTSVVVVAAGTTSTQTAVAVTTYNARSLVLAINITAGAGTLTVAINGVTTSGYTYPILTSTALTGIADNTMRVFPGATPATNTAANDALPRSLQITYSVTGSVTYGSDAILSV